MGIGGWVDFASPARHSALIGRSVSVGTESVNAAGSCVTSHWLLDPACSLQCKQWAWLSQ